MNSVEERRLQRPSPIPLFYAVFEGGRYVPWPDGFMFDDCDLERRDEYAIDLHVHEVESTKKDKLTVHAILFQNPRRRTDHYLRWDCVNGWNE